MNEPEPIAPGAPSRGATEGVSPVAAAAIRPVRSSGGRLALALQLLALLAAATALQLWQPVPWDADTTYHVAVARLLREHGVLHAFPWTTFSWLANHYADKELLFHLLLVPIAGLDWVTAARIMGAASGTALLGSMLWILRREGVRLAWLWPLVAVACSGYFAMRFALVRPHVLAVAVGLVVSFTAARRQLLPLAMASAVFPWMYIAWHLPLILVALAEAARLAGTGRFDWRVPAVTAAGLVLGLAVHPNASSLVSFWRIVHLDILLDAAWRSRSAVIGTEFLPFGPTDLAAHAALPLLAALAALGLAWRLRREDPLPLTLALTAAGWAMMTLGSQRFVEWLVPFSTTALALAARDLAPTRLAPLAAAAALAWSSLLGLDPLRNMRLRTLDVEPETEAAWRVAIPEGSQVFTCGWLTTGDLLLALPERRFLVGLDPVLFWKGDPLRADLWQRLRTNPPPLPALPIRAGFGARFVLCERPLVANWPLLQALDHDPGARAVVVDPLWVLYELRGD